MEKTWRKVWKEARRRMAGAKYSSNWAPWTGDSPWWGVNDCACLIFSYCSSSLPLDYFLVVFGVVSALCGGAGGPILMVMFGAIIQVTCSWNSIIQVTYSLKLSKLRRSHNKSCLSVSNFYMCRALPWMSTKYPVLGLVKSVEIGQKSNWLRQT